MGLHIKSALTSGRRLVAMVAVFSAIAFALFMCAGVGSVAAEEVLIEVPSTLAAATTPPRSTFEIPWPEGALAPQRKSPSISVAGPSRIGGS